MGKIVNINQNKEENKILQEILKDKEAFFSIEDEEKYSYEIIKKIFTFFENDYDFLNRVYTKLIKNVKNYWTLEFALRLNYLSKRLKRFDLKKYLCNVNSIFNLDKNQGWDLVITLETTQIMADIKAFITDENNPNVGRGFLFIEQEFYYSDLLMNYFAQIFISQIFLDIDIEKNLHKQYESYDAFTKENPNLKKYILDFILLEDSVLGNYLMNRSEILEEAEYAFQYVKKNWNMYILVRKNSTLESIADQIRDYINLHKESKDIDELWNTSFYAYYNMEILDSIFEYAVGIDPEYLEEIKGMCTQLKKSDSVIDKTEDYLYMIQLIKENLKKLPDYVLKHSFKNKE